MANARLGWFSPLGVAFRFGVAAGRVGLRAHGFRFSARTTSGLPSASWRFRLPLRGCRSAGWFFCLPLRRLPSAGWPSGSRLPLFGMRRFGVALGELVLPPSASEIAARRVGLRAHGFRFSARTASGLPSSGWFFCLPFGDGRSAGWPSGSRLPLFGMRRSAPPHRRREDRRSTPTRHLFHFKTLIPTC